MAHFKQPGKLELLEIDLTDLSSVRKGAQEFLSRSGGKLNVLVCNAGIMAVPKRELTKDGFESQFGTNHLAHFLLFELVKEALLASATPAYNSRVVTVSSSGHRSNPPRVENGDYAFEEEGSYSPWAAYGQAKCANIWMANYIDREYGAKHLHATSLMPGGIITPLQKHVPETVEAIKGNDQMNNFLKSTPQGCAMTLWAAVGKEWEGQGGKYLEDCDVAEPDEGNDPYKLSGYRSYAYNPKARTSCGPIR